MCVAFKYLPHMKSYTIPTMKLEGSQSAQEATVTSDTKHKSGGILPNLPQV